MSSSKPPVPKNWPPNVTYITAPIFSKTLTPLHLSTLRTRSQDSRDLPANTSSGPCAIVKITPVNSPSHPANGQSGLFAARDLKPGTFILQYVGELHASVGDCSLGVKPASISEAQTNPDPHANSDYDLSLDREHGIGIDADKKGNEARFINDYRGVAERPNAEFREIWDGKRGVRGMGVWVLEEGRGGKGKGKGKGGIRKGEEILVSYGRGFWAARRGDEVEK